MWEEAGLPAVNQRVFAGDSYTLSHTITVDQKVRTRVAVVCIVNCTTWTLKNNKKKPIIQHTVVVYK